MAGAFCARHPRGSQGQKGAGAFTMEPVLKGPASS